MTKPRRRWLERLVLFAIAVLVLWLVLLRVGTSPGDSEAPRAGTPHSAEVEQDSLALERETAAKPTVQGAAEPPPQVRLHGVCVEAGTSEPLPGFGVSFSDGDFSLEAETDAAGRFHAAWPFGRPARVEVRPRPGWRAGASPRVLEPEELAGAREIRLVVVPDPRARLLGRVVDARTGRGVDGLSIRITRPEASGPEEVATDARGDFATSDVVASGELAIEVADDDPDGRVPLGSFQVAHDATRAVEGEARTVLAVPIGPSFGLLIQGGEGVARDLWRARLVERRGDPLSCGVLLATPGGFVLGREPTESDDAAWSWRRLRDGERPWLRYSSVEREPSSALEAFLELETVDGTLRGVAAIETTVGARGEVLEVTVRPSATLQGRLEADFASIEASSVRLWLEREAEPSAWLGPWVPSSDGAFRMTDLEVGRYRLAVRAPLRPAFDLVLALPPGRLELGKIALAPADHAHRLEGRFECERDHGPGVVRLLVSSMEGPVESRSLSLRVASGTRGLPSIERFTLEDLSAGRYVLRTDPIAGEHRFSPDEVRLVTPAPSLLFRCRSDAPENRVRVDARTSQDEPIAEFALELGSLRLLPFTWPESRPVGRWYAWPRTTAAHWAVFAPGFQPAEGDLDDLAPGSFHPELTLKLERGFGARLALRDGPPPGAGSPAAAWRRLPPVRDVGVRADGESLGTTDENGELVIGLPLAPQRIELSHEAWRAIELQVGDLGGGVPELVVFLEPRSR